MPLECNQFIAPGNKWTSYLDIQIPEMVDYALDTGDQT